MFNNLIETGIPLSVLSQYLPNQYHKVSAGELESEPTALIVDKIGEVIAQYAMSCQ